MMSFFETIKDWIALGLLNIAEWLISRNQMKLAKWILWFIVKYIGGRDPEHEHSWRVVDIDGDPVLQCSTCGRQVRGESLLERIIKKKEKVIERLKEITDDIPDDLDAESAKQKLLQVRDSLKSLIEYLN